MAQIPPLNIFPSGLPTSDPVLAGFLTQFAQSLGYWATQVTNAINTTGQTSITLGDWAITESSTGDLVLTYTNPNNKSQVNTVVLPNPALTDRIVMYEAIP